MRCCGTGCWWPRAPRRWPVWIARATPRLCPSSSGRNGGGSEPFFLPSPRWGEGSGVRGWDFLLPSPPTPLPQGERGDFPGRMSCAPTTDPDRPSLPVVHHPRAGCCRRRLSDRGAGEAVLPEPNHLDGSADPVGRSVGIRGAYATVSGGVVM